MMDLIRLIREESAANSHAKSKFVLAFFRIASASEHSSPLPRLLTTPVRLAYRVVVDWIMGIDLPTKVTLGRRTVLYHGHSLVINEAAIIGSDCILRHSVTIGNKLLPNGESAAPIVGDRVEFGAGAVVIGALTVGSDSKIGALSVVTRSVEAGTTVAGVPARAINSLDRRAERPSQKE